MQSTELTRPHATEPGILVAQSGDIELAYETFGREADPPLLLIMGLATQMLGWPDEFCAGLADTGHYVIRFDNRDIGLSTHLDDAPPVDIAAVLSGDLSSAAYTISDMARDATGLLDALALDSAHIVGASMGGMIAQAMAIEYPHRVRSLTSIMSTTGNPAVGQPTPKATAALLAPRPPDREGTIERVVANYRVIGSPDFEFDEAALRERAARSYDRANDPAGVMRQMAAVPAGGDRTEELTTLRLPTLVIHGKQDPLATLSGGVATAEAIPNAELIVFDGMGHDLPRELWAQMTKAIAVLTRRAERDRGVANSTQPPGAQSAARMGADTTAPERDVRFATLSGEPIDPLYTERDLPEALGDSIGLPGEFPYTRGVYRSMYRGRLWTMRQFAGFGTPEETNERFHYLLDHGQTGLSTAFDMPSLMGHDSDHPRSVGEVGREGVAVDTVLDMETLFRGIPLDEVTVSMTINAPAAIMLAFYVVAAGRQGIPSDRLGGTIQTDILKEYIAQKEWCFPVDPAMRLVTDMIEWCSVNMPRWHPVSISGYHIREAGSTAVQELAFTLKDGLTYVEHAIARGLDVDDFAPRLSFFFNAQIDFFEEIAKYRAARRIWARELRDTFGARDERSLLMRFHTQTAGVSLTAQQPLNNIVRTTIEALAGVLGGTQSLHTNSYDEALALPTEEAVRIALRTQQIIADESGVTNTVDPLGGSYFVEALTDRMQAGCYDYFRKIDELGGMVEAVKQGYPQREIADAAFELQTDVDSGRRVVVGVNRYTEGDDAQTQILRIDPALEGKQIERVRAAKAHRDGAAVQAVLSELKRAAGSSVNLMPVLLDAAEVHASEGEIVEALQEVWGGYREQPVF
jgi:methylmalonyl-CoA mutase N-terminal domain/subunit